MVIQIKLAVQVAGNLPAEIEPVRAANSSSITPIKLTKNRLTRNVDRSRRLRHNLLEYNTDYLTLISANTAMTEKLSAYKLVRSQTVFDHPWVRIVQDLLEYEGKLFPYFYLASPVEAVATVGLTAQGEIILTRQYRHPIGQVIYDLPAGRLEPGEDPLAGARREFEEETGFYPRQIEQLGYYNQFPGTLRAATNLFFAHDLQATHQHLDPGEFLDVVLKPVSEVKEMILSGKIIDGSLQLGVLLALQKGLL